SGQNTGAFAVAPGASLALCGAHGGGTLRNRSENEAESQRERRSPARGVLAPASATVKAMRGLRGRAARVNEALTTSATWLRQQRDCRARAKPVVRVDGHPCHVNHRDGRSLRRGRRRSTSR